MAKNIQVRFYRTNYLNRLSELIPEAQKRIVLRGR